MQYTNSQMCHLIDEVCHSERDRALLKRRLCDGIAHERIAWEFGISVQQEKAIVYKWREILSGHL